MSDEPIDVTLMSDRFVRYDYGRPQNVPSRPSRDETLLDVAHVIARRSTCSRGSVGAVLALDGRVLSTGYNGAPEGLPHCDHPLSEGGRIDKSDDEAGTSNRGCQTAVHAEMNAVIYAARHGTKTDGATLYTTYTPCAACAQAIINSGVVRVVAAKEYRRKEGVHLLRQAGIIIDVMTE